MLLGSSLIELPTHSMLSLRKTPGKSGHELGTRGTDRLAFPHTSGIDMDRPTYITTFMTYRLNQAEVISPKGRLSGLLYTGKRFNGNPISSKS